MKSFGAEKLLVDGIIWDRKTFGEWNHLKNFWGWNHLRQKNFLWMKPFGTEKLLVNGIIWDRKTFGEWDHLGQENFW